MSFRLAVDMYYSASVKLIRFIVRATEVLGQFGGSHARSPRVPMS